jgi:hypothetical protein
MQLCKLGVDTDASIHPPGEVGYDSCLFCRHHFVSRLPRGHQTLKRECGSGCLVAVLVDIVVVGRLINIVVVGRLVDIVVLGRLVDIVVLGRLVVVGRLVVIIVGRLDGHLDGHLVTYSANRGQGRCRRCSRFQLHSRGNGRVKLELVRRLGLLVGAHQVTHALGTYGSLKHRGKV